MTCSCLSEAKGMTKNMNKISEVTRQDIIAVSYTHLDVYKRQVSVCRLQSKK